jgi:hypothetical protein
MTRLDPQSESLRRLGRNAETWGNETLDEVPAGTVNGVNADFTLINRPREDTLRIYNNGLRLAPITDFTTSLVAGVFTVTFVTAPATGDLLRADYRS